LHTDPIEFLESWNKIKGRIETERRENRPKERQKEIAGLRRELASRGPETLDGPVSSFDLTVRLLEALDPDDEPQGDFDEE
jgi:hypothetical protein